jgi:DNA (cytosine-5)-methyltransferase 1
VVQRHLFWSNFCIPAIEIARVNMHGASITELQIRYGFDLSPYKLTNKRQILRNCVHPVLGKHILTLAEGNATATDKNTASSG